MAPAKARVLVADDDALARSLVCAALADHGFATVEAEDGAQAVALFEAEGADIVLLDLQMPVLDGFAACAALRAMAGGREVPIVVITGASDTESIHRVYDTGATDYVTKPLNWALLGHRIEYILHSARTRAALIQSEENNRAMLEALPDRMLIVDGSGHVQRVFEPGHGAEVQHVDAPLETFLPYEGAMLAKGVVARVVSARQEERFEYTDNRTDAARHLEARVVPQGEALALLVVRDVTEKREAEERIRRLAYYDSLTGLPNRHYFSQYLGDVVDRSRFAGETQSLLLVGLDQFKRVNDTLGHQAGDHVLKVISSRLKGVVKALRGQGTFLDLARVAGDEFALLVSHANDLELGEAINAIEAAPLEPIDADGYQLAVTASIGVATTPDDGDDIAGLLQHAAQALSAAKGQGGGSHRRYADIPHSAGKEALQFDLALRQALYRDELELYLQPKVLLADGRVVGAECLLRWCHPTLGQVSPAVFIPLAEQSGLIAEIDRWVLSRAAELLGRWQSRGVPCVPVSVNVSGRVFGYGQLQTEVARVLEQYAIDPAMLQLEITETAIMADAGSTAEVLDQLKGLCVALAIDDFGTGYSSLAYLKQFPLDVVKIDREFVKDLEHDASDRALCRAIVSMAQSLNLGVVAEGIETVERRELLVAMGCEVGQGYLFAKPMQDEQFETLLARSGDTEPATLSPAPEPGAQPLQ